jgi:acyl-CoA synthetase (AMP-forming)/AMP-acid ligase II
MVLANGPEAAAAFVSIASTAVAAPLNPAYRDKEFDFYLSDLNPKALVLTDNIDSPARQVALERGIDLFILHPEGAAGNFWLEFNASSYKADNTLKNLTVGNNIALVLHTSGTTSHPKLVLLTHANLVASANNISSSLQLKSSDLCLNIMPLFHVHGLVGAVLSSLAAGASVCCAPGFNAMKFFHWLDLAQPNWYTAVPTMHQAILARAAHNLDSLQRNRLRLIRSSSSALLPQVMIALEQNFGCPVIESYGMTEAAHQITSNPLPPKLRKPGSVGVAAGPDVVILDAEGRTLLPGVIGEVAISGANVSGCYEVKGTTNSSLSTSSWFRTGDQGLFDQDGYLFLTGRLKELINRGGEKISPFEVETVLMDHPAVSQVVVFAVPHAKLGEEVAAVVVLHENSKVEESDLQAFAKGRLADFKVPWRFFFVTEIPKGPTGKLQRLSLAEKLL